MELLPPDRDQLATKSDVARVDDRVALLDEKVDALDRRMERFEERLWEFHEALRSQIRVFVTALVTTMLGVGSIVLAAAALV